MPHAAITHGDAWIRENNEADTERPAEATAKSLPEEREDEFIIRKTFLLQNV
jgi:hypothetical protein